MPLTQAEPADTEITEGFGPIPGPSSAPERLAGPYPLSPDRRECSHGIGLAKTDYCPHCELLWHEPALDAALASVARHRRKIAEAIAAISRTCGDA